MKLRCCLCLLLLLLPLGARAAAVASAVPVLHALNRSLLEGTGLEARYLPPARLPVNRIGGWLGKADAGQLAPAEALLTIESVWPGLELYPLLRQLDIRVVPIDVASEIAPGGARVTQRPGLTTPDYFWLDFANLTLMANVAARDLARLWPEQAGQIEANRLALQRHIQQQAMRLDELLLSHDIGSVALMDERLTPLAQAMALPLVAPESADLLLAAGKAEAGTAAVWELDPLARPQRRNLGGWLTSQVDALERQLAP